ncbi:polysaccharide deacetylase family protein [Microtetraspora sp. AC03309]|uniref:polysaccharide deacetylase family protein n=1 Tax=Microtetraspora sp. AC03309 TaxID=2779376 RepID=UPI001E64712E|nr:polysaccharide deacetylase family protein [Microtetraspora sp. AC03309]MCC5581137.1 polysaccharide deacetylase family protein [Microtetraspora sp. AC03309]
MNLAQRLGGRSEDRLLIVNADDYGMCRAANTGITSLLAARAISSATVMTPCPWAPDAVRTAAAGGYDVGVHLTFTSEWEGYRWGPVTRDRAVSSLVDEAGYFPADCRTVEERADPDEVRAEITNQIRRAVTLGLDPSHADNHMGSLYGLATGRDFLDVVFTVCAEHGLPFRLPRTLDGMGLPEELEPVVQARAEAADAAGVVILDRLWTLTFEQAEGETYESVRDDMIGLIRALRPGVTEIYIHPFEETAELRHIMPHHAKRAMELRLFTDPEVRRVIAEEGVTLIGWADLRALQRAR